MSRVKSQSLPIKRFPGKPVKIIIPDIAPKKRKSYVRRAKIAAWTRRPTVMLFQGAWRELCRQVWGGELHHREFELLILLVAHLEFHNIIALPQREVAEIFGCKRPYISKLYKRLIGRDLLQKLDCGHGVVAYQVSPYICWRGSAARWDQWRKAQNATEEEKSKQSTF